MHWFFTDGDGSVTSAGSRPGDDAHNGGAVMFHQGRILTCGGAEAFATPAFAPHTTATVIEIKRAGSLASTRRVADMNTARTYMSTVVLPDGKVLVDGGSKEAREFSDTLPVLQPGAPLPLQCRGTASPHCACPGDLRPATACVATKGCDRKTCNPSTDSTLPNRLSTLLLQQRDLIRTHAT